MMELEQSLRNNPDFRFVSVATSGNPESDESDPALKDETQAFLTERNSPIVTYKDPLAAEQKRLVELSGRSDSGVPLTVVLDKQGMIRGFWLGYLPGDELSMREVIDEALRP
jgi:hypothetical protein